MLTAAQQYIEDRTERICESGCWIWMLATMPTGWPYGQCTYKKRHMYAHRLAWEAYYGPIPQGLHVLHRCDTPPCCNPHHLFLGKDKENKEDQVKKGRSLRGEDHNMAKLSEQQAREILALCGIVSDAELARRYNVSDATIWMIRHRRTWRHLPA